MIFQSIITVLVLLNESSFSAAALNAPEGKQNYYYRRVPVASATSSSSSGASVIKRNQNTNDNSNSNTNNGSGGFLSQLKHQFDVASRNLLTATTSSATAPDVPHRRQQQEDEGMLCTVVEEMFGTDFVEGTGQGTCSCTGMLNSTVNLGCNFTDVCDIETNVCGDMEFNVTLSGVWIEGQGFGSNPTLTISACTTITDSRMEEVCMVIDYATPDFFLPKSCGVTYGGEDCTCTVNTTNLLPCIEWDCSAVAPIDIAEMIQSDKCQNVQWTDTEEGSGSTIPAPNGTVTVSSFLPSMNEIPPLNNESSTSDLTEDDSASAPTFSIITACSVGLLLFSTTLLV